MIVLQLNCTEWMQGVSNVSVRLRGADLSLVGEARAEIVDPVTARVDARKGAQRVGRLAHEHDFAQLHGAPETTFQVHGVVARLMRRT